MDVPVRGSLPGNSDKDKERVSKQITSKPGRHIAPSFRDRAMNALFGDDLKSVGSYLFWDIAIPAFKNMVYEMVVGGTERTLFSQGGAPAYQRPTTPRYTSYNRVYQSRTYGTTPGSERTLTKSVYQPVVLDSKSEADAVVTELTNIVDTYGSASVGDLYGMVGISADYPVEDRGWTNLTSAQVTRVRDGYLLDLPSPVKIN